jgi:hypothetical protein
MTLSQLRAVRSLKDSPGDGMMLVRGGTRGVKEDVVRRFVMVLWAVMVGILAGGLTTAFAGTRIVQEETVVFGEHTLRGRNLDLVGRANDFRPGDRYIFRSELTDAQDAVAGHLFVDCSVQFAKKDSCSQIYEIPARGTVTAEGLIPVSQLKPDGTWVLAITGGTGEFENVGGSVTVVIVDDRGNSEHSLHLLP